MKNLLHKKTKRKNKGNIKKRFTKRRYPLHKGGATADEEEQLSIAEKNRDASRAKLQQAQAELEAINEKIRVNEMSNSRITRWLVSYYTKKKEEKEREINTKELILKKHTENHDSLHVAKDELIKARTKRKAELIKKQNDGTITPDEKNELDNMDNKTRDVHAAKKTADEEGAKIKNDNTKDALKKAKYILADYIILKIEAKSNSNSSETYSLRENELLNTNYNKLIELATNGDEKDIKKILFDHQKSLFAKKQIAEEQKITEDEFNLIKDYKEPITQMLDSPSNFEKAKNALSSTGTAISSVGSNIKNGVVSAFSGITSAVSSGANFLTAQPSGPTPPKPLPKTEIFIDTETTPYLNIDKTHIGQTSVYKKTNSGATDSIKSAENFLSRLQKSILNDAEKDPAEVKKYEEMFKDTSKRVTTLYPLKDNTPIKESPPIKGGKK